MVFRCPKGSKKSFRFIKGTNKRLGGCMTKGRFIIVKEIVEVRKNGNRR